LLIFSDPDALVEIEATTPEQFNEEGSKEGEAGEEEDGEGTKEQQQTTAASRKERKLRQKVGQQPAQCLNPQSGRLDSMDFTSQSDCARLAAPDHPVLTPGGAAEHFLAEKGGDQLAFDLLKLSKLKFIMQILLINTSISPH
jgi:hypothetical protein